MSDDEAGLTVKEETLLAGETLVYAKRVTRASYGTTSIDSALVVLTEKRLIAAKSKVFGTPKPDIQVSWSEVSRAHGEPWAARPTEIVLTFETTRGPLVIINDGSSVYEIETRGRAIYSK